MILPNYQPLWYSSLVEVSCKPGQAVADDNLVSDSVRRLKRLDWGVVR